MAFAGGGLVGYGRSGLRPARSPASLSPQSSVHLIELADAIFCSSTDDRQAGGFSADHPPAFASRFASVRLSNLNLIDRRVHG
jgi:hypothetical protein